MDVKFGVEFLFRKPSEEKTGFTAEYAENAERNNCLHKPT
jgi:hypothetical protein